MDLSYTIKVVVTLGQVLLYGFLAVLTCASVAMVAYTAAFTKKMAKEGKRLFIGYVVNEESEEDSGDSSSSSNGSSNDNRCLAVGGFCLLALVLILLNQIGVLG